MGFGDGSQEADTKGKTAISGEEAKPEDPKKPRGDSREDEAAAKREKKQKDQTADAREVTGR